MHCDSAGSPTTVIIKTFFVPSNQILPPCGRYWFYLKYMLFIFYFYYFHYYRCLYLPHALHTSPPPSPSLPSGHNCTFCCVYGLKKDNYWFLYTVVIMHLLKFSILCCKYNLIVCPLQFIHIDQHIHKILHCFLLKKCMLMESHVS